jgi:general secretion pathway protein K
VNIPTQRGAALLTAMLTVTLVATFAAAALWQTWRSVEIEAAERSRAQVQWVLNGALDWARLILQEDARNGAVDHLSEPWALPLQEARLSSFLALDSNNTDDAMDAFLSGQISDEQALLNVRNLVQDGKPYPPSVQAFGRLFAMLKLPMAQLNLLIDGLVDSDAATPASGTGSNQPASATSLTDTGQGSTASAPLKPHRLEQLIWLGLPMASVQALRPYATLLPGPTPLNLNTASAEVLHAALPDTDLPRAQQLVHTRAASAYRSVPDALLAMGQLEGVAAQVDAKDFSVGSRFFAVRGRLRLGESAVQEVSVVEREGATVSVVWRQRESLQTTAIASLQ